MPPAAFQLVSDESLTLTPQDVTPVPRLEATELLDVRPGAATVHVARRGACRTDCNDGRWPV